MSRTKTDSPLVFRVRDYELREGVEKFAKAESKRLGCRIGSLDVVERALREFLARRKRGLKP